MTALIDADTIAFKIAITHQDEVDWGDGDLDVSFDYNLAIKTVKKELNDILKNTKCSKYELWLTGKDNFRHGLGSYKENRKDKVLPIGLEPLRNYMIDKLGANVAHSMEADDVVVYKKNEYPNDYVLCAIDKDVLYQATGHHYNYNKGEWVYVEADEATRYWWTQVLTGDVTDGYKGCLQVGKVKAGKILDNLDGDTYEIAVAKAYKDRDHHYDYWVSQVRMASMFQFNGTEIVLWEPSITEEEFDKLLDKKES